MPKTAITKEQEQQVIQMYSEGESTNKIGPKIGLSPTTCVNILKRNNIARNNFLITKEEEIKIIELYKTGLTFEQIANELNINFVSCHSVLKRNNEIIRTRNEYAAGHKLYTQDDNFFETIDTEEKAYWLGFISADGNVNKPLNRISIRLAMKDRDHLAKFLKSLKSTSNVKYHTSKCRGKKHAGCHIEINSTKMAKDLNNLGITPNKTYSLKPWMGSSHLLPAYWRGYIDGDGCLSKYKNGRGILTLIGNEDVIRLFAVWADEQLRIEGTKVSKIKIKNRLKDPIKSKIPIYRVQYVCDKCDYLLNLLYSNATIYLDRKYKRALSLVYNKPEEWIKY